MYKLTNIMGSAACLALLIGTNVNASEAPILKIENFIGTVDVITGDYKSITITDADGTPVEKTGNNVTINANEKVNNTNCMSNDSNVKIRVGGWKFSKRKGGYKNIEDYPTIEIKAPRDTHLIIGNSVIFGDIESIGSADIHILSCGDLNLGDITGALKMKISGDGDVDMGDAGKTDISISGSGDLTIGDLTSADIRISGAGDLDVGDILGHADVAASGAGDISIHRITGGLRYEGSGASDFDAEYVSGGDLYIRTSGSGDVDIDDGSVDDLYVKATGASSVNYDGSSVNGEARASGASDVTVKRSSKSFEHSDGGAGSIRIRR